MFSKLYLAIASCIALVAFMGFSANALANHVFDSDCAADPDAFELTNFTIDTPDSHVAFEVSGITGTGRACGSRIHNWNIIDGYVGEETLNDLAVIQNAPGVLVHAAPSVNLPKGTYVGAAEVDALTWILLNAAPVSDSQLTLRVDDRDDPITPPGGFWGSPDCPADALACYRGKSDTGHGWTWVKENADGSTELTIGRFYNHATGEPAGLTEIDFFSLCGYAGEVGGISCGDGADPSKWLQRNGAASIGIPPGSADCSSGRGIYSATAINLSNQTTPEVSACVTWTYGPPLESGGSTPNTIPLPPGDSPCKSQRKRRRGGIIACPPPSNIANVILP